jgi:hypothetical protein
MVQQQHTIRPIKQNHTHYTHKSPALPKLQKHNYQHAPEVQEEPVHRPTWRGPTTAGHTAQDKTTAAHSVKTEDQHFSTVMPTHPMAHV